MQRDIVLPERLQRLAELRGLLTGYQLLGAEQKRTSNAYLFYVENSYKALRGRHLSLQDREFFRSLVANEEALKAQLAKDPGTKDALGAFDAIAKAQDRLLQIRDEYNALERGFQGTLFAIARDLVRGAAERGKPNPDRLREYRESNLPALTQETLQRGADLPRVRDAPARPLPLEDPRAAGARSSVREEAAREGVAGGGREARSPGDEARRGPGAQAALGGRRAVRRRRERSLLALAAAIDPDARAVRRTLEDEVESVVQKNHERIAQARFAVQGRTTYPDATFTLRLSYGTVEGWSEKGKPVEPFTVLAGAYERHTGRDPFALPESWLASKGKLNLQTRFNFVTTNDIIGGNSGSPVIDRNAQIVGLVFDGNIHSLGGDYGFDPSVNRTVAVHSAAISGGAHEDLRRRPRGAGAAAGHEGRQVVADREQVAHDPDPRARRSGRRSGPLLRPHRARHHRPS